MTLEELQEEKREIEKQIGKLVQEFERKFSCYAELRQNAGPILSAKTYRTFTVDVEVHL